ncbi:MAG: chromosome partition protein Smc [Pirellulaceae bacterium]|nr:MAG: chromosome partition protein Smc [Pirellulaceae bacterium]
MLQALELYGFKSFADKTRFEFPPGITVIVGPNGSGKSNVVDAIRWVLGEQSAKSLRGKEMADVIFKGTTARKMMGMAEATIIFDNRQRQLAVDADEVRITRRVYRSGEGEYLINGQPCRLKDIRDLFRGTGVGTDAYSIIEQGKVDQLLQASPKDRRALFEEAAGISRFRAKKQEALRRLERVEQNLLRLGDVVDEVRQRLETLRSQASKARQYRQLTERLQQLRTEVAWYDWRQLDRRFQEAQKKLENEQQKLHEVAGQRQVAEEQLAELDQAWQELQQEWQQNRDRWAQLRDQITSRQSLVDLERARLDELHDELMLSLRHERQAARRADELRRRSAELETQVDEQRRLCTVLEDHRQEQDRLLAGLHAEWEQLDQQGHALRLKQLELMRRLGRTGREQSRLAAELAALEAASSAAEREAADLSRAVFERQERLTRLAAEEAQQSALYETAQRATHEAQQQLAQARRVHSRRQQEALQLRASQQATTERLALLDEWFRSGQASSPGVRQLLELRNQGQADILGVVAELFECDPADAPFIDAALGPAGQWVVLSSDAALHRLAEGAAELSGPVHLVSLESVPRRFEQRPARWEGRPGVLRRLDRMVNCPEALRPLAEYLLGRTYLVESLAVAWQCHRSTPGRARFVTLDGMVLEKDGTLTAGPPPSDQQLITRRSEMEALRGELSRLERLAGEAEAEVRRWLDNLERHEIQLRRLQEEERTAHETLAHKRVAVQSASQELAALEARYQEAEQKRHQAASLVTSLREQLQAVADESNQLENELRQIEQQLTHTLDERDQADRRRQQQLEVRAQAQIDWSAAVQRLEALQSQWAQLQEALHEAARTLDEARQHGERSRQRRRASEQLVLNATSELAQLYWEKQQVERLQELVEERRTELDRNRQQLQRTVQQLTRRFQQLQESVHRLELDAEQLRQARQLHQERVRDELGLDIAAWEGTALAELAPNKRAEVEQEIDQLRRQIQQFGAVNLQALDELDAFEQRYASLAEQYNDLLSAKQSLERLIGRIDADCRRLFLETLEGIRANFQAIYRKAFGGGRADLVLEEGVDVLEAGIDIVATPPGKPTFSNSLLSGGERALTAVALLLAIFQYRPSPFCVLDEVDAPFDEANIERFIEVLREFLSWTKFVIVTHSKKTMTAATTLHGVTMQESGISKRVSVRFDDVSDDGQIASEALAREAG